MVTLMMNKSKIRSLKDWQGTWQSVYPLVAKGELDQVFHYKAKLNPKKTAEDYRAYYEKGYRTDVITNRDSRRYFHLHV